MDFKANSVKFGTYIGLNSIDGVQVRISDDFIPPKKVTLPMQLKENFHCQNPAEVLFMEYDFSLEECVIKWTEAFKPARKMKQCAQAAAGDDNETCAKQLQEGSSCCIETRPVAMGGRDLKTDGNSCDALPNGDLPSEVANEEQTPCTNKQLSASTKLLLPGLGTEILIPMQLSTSKPQVSTPGSQKKETFDLADFEREKEQDPFDNAELRVLNDIEELNKVLQCVQGITSVASNVPVTSVAGSNSCTLSGVGSDNVVDGSMPAILPAVSSEMVPMTETCRGTGATRTVLDDHSNTVTVQITQSTCAVSSQQNYSQSIKNIDYPELDSPGNKDPQMTGQQCSNSLYSLPQKPALAPSTVSYTTPVSYVMPTITGLNRMSNTSSTTSSSVLFSSANTGHIPAASVSGSANHPVSNVGMSLANGHLPYPFSVLSHGAAWPSIQDAFAASSSRSTVGHQLRAVSSTPDISALSDETPITQMTSQTPPPSLRSKDTHDTLNKLMKKTDVCCVPLTNVQSYTSTASNKEADQTNPWGPPTKYQAKAAQTQMPIHHGLSDKQSHGCSVGGSTSYLPDPYPTMSKEARELVDGISMMGFPRPRVAQAVEKHGTDDKVVIDYLCLVARLSERFSSDDVETALDTYNNNEKQAVKYLTLVTQFCELGFPKDRVKDAVTKSKLDENKTLDILTGNT